MKQVTYHIAVDAASIARDLGCAMDLFREMRVRYVGERVDVRCPLHQRCSFWCLSATPAAVVLLRQAVQQLRIAASCLPETLLFMTPTTWNFRLRLRYHRLCRPSSTPMEFAPIPARRGLPVTKRRVEYIQAKISGGDGRSGGGRKNDRSRLKERTKVEDVVAKSSRDDGTSSPCESRAVKKVSRGALHGGGGGGGVAQGKLGAGGGKQAADGEEEAGADFLEELRQRFAVETEELASDSDLDLLADDVLLAGPISSGEVKTNGETGAATMSVDITAPVSGVDGDDRMSEDGRSEADETVAETAYEAVESDISGQGEEDTNKAQLLLEFKTMKVRRASTK